MVMKILIEMFFKLKEGSRTRELKAVLVKEQCWFDVRKNSFSHRTINGTNYLMIVSDILCKGRLYTDDKLLDSR